MNMTAESFDVIQAGETRDIAEQEWLIEGLWGRESTGIIGGEPKVCKSWLALEMALSVASKTPCLGRFKISRSGVSMAYFAEDSRKNTYLRFQKLCLGKNIEPETVPMYLIDAPILRLDSQEDREKLEGTIARYRPVFLVLDPLVRLHSLDENSAREMAGLLSYIRGLQRKYELAIALTHHSSKKRCSRPGQSLRGSTDLHAFGDTNLYLSRTKSSIRLNIEHRDAPSDSAGLNIHLKNTAGNDGLQLTSTPREKLRESEENEDVRPETNLEHLIRATLREAGAPLKSTDLRKKLGVRYKRMADSLTQLEQKGILLKHHTGWMLA